MNCHVQFVGLTGTNLVPIVGWCRTVNKASNKISFLQLGQGGVDLNYLLNVGSNTLWTTFNTLQPDLFTFRMDHETSYTGSYYTNLAWLTYLVTNASPNCEMLFFGVPPSVTDLAWPSGNSALHGFCTTNQWMFWDLASQAPSTNFMMANHWFTSDDGMHHTVQALYQMEQPFLNLAGWSQAGPTGGGLSQQNQFNRLSVGTPATQDDTIGFQVGTPRGGGVLQFKGIDGQPYNIIAQNNTPYFQLGGGVIYDELPAGGSEWWLRGPVGHTDMLRWTNGGIFIGNYSPTPPADPGLGSLTVQQDVYAVHYHGDGSLLTGIAGGSSNVTFQTILSGTSTGAVMVVSNGASLSAAGSGTIAATTAANASNVTAATLTNAVNTPGAGSFAGGLVAHGSGAGSEALGISASAFGTDAVALGDNSAAYNFSVALGYNAQAQGSNEVAVGVNSAALAGGATAIGEISQAAATNSTAIGQNSYAQYASSTAIGYNSHTTTSNQVMLGTANETVVAPGGISTPQFNVGTLIVSNAPNLNGANITNVQGANVVGAVASATLATTATTANALATGATLTQAQVTNAIPAVITNSISGNAATATVAQFDSQAVLTNMIPSTNVLVSAQVLASSGSVTNYTVDLYSGPSGNLVTIYLVNTNTYITFTGTNHANWQRTVLFMGWTNTLTSRIAFISGVRTNLNFNTYVTNGMSKVVSFYNTDTTGTNLLVSDAGFFQ